MNLFLIFIFSQSSPILSDVNHTLFSHKENFYILTKDSLHTYSGDLWTATKHNLEFNSYIFGTVQNNSSTYLIAPGGGKVLSFNNGILEEISTSGFWDTTHESFDFIRNDTIYSYGGYGHYNTRNALIYFDRPSGEWFDIKTNHKRIKSRRYKIIGNFNNKGDALYIGLGIDNDRQLNSNIIKFDFKSGDWNNYAELGRNFGFEYQIVSNYKLPLIIYDNKKITFDYVNKKYNIYENPSSFLASYIKVHYNNVINKFLISKRSNGIINTVVIDEINFFKNLKYTKSFKKNNLPIFLGILILLGLLLILFRFRKKTTIFKIIYKNLKKIKSELDEFDLIFFEKILSSHPKPVKYQDLMRLLDNTLAYETKVKKIGDIKLRIDAVLCRYCKSKTPILKSKKNVHDNRIRELYLDTI